MCLNVFIGYKIGLPCYVITLIMSMSEPLNDVLRPCQRCAGLTMSLDLFTPIAHRTDFIQIVPNELIVYS